jgi:hypothetical protein
MDQTAPFCLLLLGQPTLRRRLRQGTFAALDQRIAVRYAISGLDRAETTSYIAHHLALAGRSDTLFSDDAITLIYEVSRGSATPGQQPRRRGADRGVRRKEGDRRRVRRPDRGRRALRRMTDSVRPLSLLDQPPPDDQPPDAAAPPPPAGWPAPPAPAVYHELLGEIVARIAPHTEADPVAILTQLLIAFGGAVGRGTHFQVEATRHHANEFMLLVGDSSKARKGSSGITSDGCWATSTRRSGTRP